MRGYNRWPIGEIESDEAAEKGFAMYLFIIAGILILLLGLFL